MILLPDRTTIETSIEVKYSDAHGVLSNTQAEAVLGFLNLPDEAQLPSVNFQLHDSADHQLKLELTIEDARRDEKLAKVLKIEIQMRHAKRSPAQS